MSIEKQGDCFIIKPYIYGDGKRALLIDSEVPHGIIFNWIFPAGKTRYRSVLSVRGNEQELKRDPGFILGEDSSVQFRTFPEYQCGVQLLYTVFAKRKS